MPEAANFTSGEAAAMSLFPEQLGLKEPFDGTIGHSSALA